MKKVLYSLLIFLTISCGQESKHDHSESIDYNSKIHKLGSEKNWMTLKRDIEFYQLTKGNPILKLPQERKDHLQAKQALKTLHSWFVDGSGYTTMTIGDYEVLLLRNIPEVVFHEILTRVTETKNGFGFLDANFWRQIYSNQAEGIKFGFINKARQTVSGFYIREHLLIGLNVFASSATIEHELQHHRDFEKLEPLDGNSKYFSKECQNELSRFLGEISASVVQMPIWADVFNNNLFINTTLDDHEFSFGNKGAYSIDKLFHLNMNLPFNVWIQTISNGNNCPQDIQDMTLEIANVSSQYDNIFVGWYDAMNLTHTYKKKYGHLLWLEKNGCSEMIKGETIASCEKIESRKKDVVLSSQEQKEQVVDKINKIYHQRKSVVSEILQTLDKNQYNEACNNILGFSSLTDCEKIKR